MKSPMHLFSAGIIIQSFSSICFALSVFQIISINVAIFFCILSCSFFLSGILAHQILVNEVTDKQPKSAPSELFSS